MAKLDRRVRKTRRALQEALLALILEKGFESITVQDVLDRADVGRSTFYAHFYDLEHLLESEFEVLQVEFEQFMATHTGTTPDSTVNIWAFSQMLFHHAQGYRHLYKVVVGKESGRMIREHFHQFLRDKIHDSLQAEYRDIQAKLVTTDILVHHLVSTFMALLGLWLDKDLSYSPDEMAQLYRMLVQSGLDGLNAGNKAR